MHRRLFGVVLFVGLVVATAGTLSAQQPQQPSTQPSIMNDEGDTPSSTAPAKPRRKHAAAPAFEHDPDLDADDQLAPSQMIQPMPGAVEEPGHGSRSHAASRGTDAVAEPRTGGRISRTAAPYVVSCSGVFGRDSSQVKLAMAFRSRNVTFTQVDAASGRKTMASVVFAKDPKRRLEVWWSKPSNRSDTHLIVINGTSEWTAPGEVRLGLTLAELQRLNGKPFKLSGFDKGNVATLSNWNGGTLASLAGGCRIGVSLRAASTAATSAIGALPADREFSSADAALRSVNPTVSEILVAY